MTACMHDCCSPSLFSFMTPNFFTAVLSVLMFSMGITLTVDDFQRVLTNLQPVMLGFVACYGMMPLLALAVGKGMSWLAGHEEQASKKSIKTSINNKVINVCIFSVGKMN